MVAVGFIWNWWRTGHFFRTPLPRPYRDRPLQESLWALRYHGNPPKEIDGVLSLLCEAFGFAPEVRYKFAPDDRVRDIHRACYSRFGQVADNMEIEDLMIA